MTLGPPLPWVGLGHWQNRLAELRRRMVVTALCVTFYFYPSLLTTVLSLFSCFRIDPSRPAANQLYPQNAEVSLFVSVSAQCLCLMLNVLMPNGQCLMSRIQCITPDAQCAMPSYKQRLHPQDADARASLSACLETRICLDCMQLIGLFWALLALSLACLLVLLPACLPACWPLWNSAPLNI